MNLSCADACFLAALASVVVFRTPPQESAPVTPRRDASPSAVERLRSEGATVVCHWDEPAKSVDWNGRSKAVDLELLRGLQVLETLRLSQVSFDPSGTTVFEDMPGLRGLHIHRCAEIDIGREVLDRLPNPERLLALVVAQSEFDDGDVSSLLRCSNLRELDLSSTRITDDGVSRILAGLPRLEELFLWDNRIDGTGLERIGDPTRLRIVHLQDCDLRDDALRRAVPSESITTLMLSGNPDLADEFVAALDGWTSLRSLWVDRTSVTGSGFAAWEVGPSLVSLDCSRTRVGDEAFAAFSRMPSLRTLLIDRSRVTFRGAREFIERAPHIEKFPSSSAWTKEEQEDHSRLVGPRSSLGCGGGDSYRGPWHRILRNRYGPP